MSGEDCADYVAAGIMPEDQIPTRAYSRSHFNSHGSPVRF